MATFEKGTVYEGTVCSICFDCFKTPRYLPCKHSFCHNCLSSYIASHCKSMESRLGFHCPVCRDYIPNICAAENPEEWTTCFPENRVLEKYVSRTDQQFCEACLRESEEEEATYFCLHCNENLCANCIKYHKRGLTTRKHEIVSLSETSRIDDLPILNKEGECVKHQERPIELFCQDHEEPCCTMCVSTKHRKCETVEPIEETAIKLKQYFEGKEFDLFLEHVKIFEKKLESSKIEQESYVRQMENTSDRISEDTERVFEEAIQHLQFLKNQFLINMSKGVKEGKGKYERNINSLLDGIYCARFSGTILAKSKEILNAAELSVAYYKGKKCFERLRKYDFQQLHITMKVEKPKILKEIMNLANVTPVQFLENTNNIKSDIKKIHLRLISEINLDGKYIRDGTILSSGEFILSIRDTRDTSRYRRSSDECLIYNKYGKLTNRITNLSQPFGIIEHDKEIIVACTDSKRLRYFNTNNLHWSEYLGLWSEPYCFTSSLIDGVTYLFVACGELIIKIPKNNGYYTKYQTRHSVKHIASTSSNIIYSNRKTNEVEATDMCCFTVWRYSSPGLLSPCGLGVDGEDNIYVAGKESDNIHVLNKDGRCVHVFENITRPDFMKVDKERKLCFVGSMRKYVRVYEML